MLILCHCYRYCCWFDTIKKSTSIPLCWCVLVGRFVCIVCQCVYEHDTVEKARHCESYSHASKVDNMNSYFNYMENIFIKWREVTFCKCVCLECYIRTLWYSTSTQALSFIFSFLLFWYYRFGFHSI